MTEARAKLFGVSMVIIIKVINLLKWFYTTLNKMGENIDFD